MRYTAEEFQKPQVWLITYIWLITFRSIPINISIPLYKQKSEVVSLTWTSPWRTLNRVGAYMQKVMNPLGSPAPSEDWI